MSSVTNSNEKNSNERNSNSHSHRNEIVIEEEEGEEGEDFELDDNERRLSVTVTTNATKKRSMKTEDDDLYSSDSDSDHGKGTKHENENEDDDDDDDDDDEKKNKKFWRATEEVCDGCKHVSPCLQQGVCLDPTVISSSRMSTDVGRAGGATFAHQAQKNMFLIEGQMVEKNGELWRATTLPNKRKNNSNPSNTMNESTINRTISAQESLLIPIGLPADAEEARKFLENTNCAKIPHGNHVDFLFKDHLLHFYETKIDVMNENNEAFGDDDENNGFGMCGSDCTSTHLDSNNKTTLMNSSFVEDHGTITEVIRRQRKGHSVNLGGGDYVPFVKLTGTSNQKQSQGKEKEESNIVIVGGDQVVLDIRQIVEQERRGGNEIAVNTRLKVEGICCPSEVPLIHSILDNLNGVRNVKVIVPTKMVLVEHAKSYAPIESLVDALNTAHLRASVADVDYYEKNQDMNKKTKFQSFVANLPGPKILLACFFTIVSMLHFIGGDIFKYFKFAALGAIAVGLPEIILKSYGSLRMCVVDINTLMAIAIAGAVALQDYFEAAAVVSLFTLSEWLESRAMAKTSDAMSAVLALRVDEAELLCKEFTNNNNNNSIKGNSTQKVAVESVNIGEIIRVRPGARVPLDGVVIDGSTAIDESALTGESKPVIKTVDSLVFGGTVNQKGSIDVRVTSISVDSAYSRLIRLVEDAQSMRSSAERMIESFAKWYTPLVIFAAFLYGTIPVIIDRDNAKESLYTACVLLVIACPCALVLSTPVVAVCGLTVCARRGVVVKGSQFLERLGQLKTIFIDKTGTLTTGTFEMTEVKLATPSDEENVPRPALGVGALLRWVVAVESKSSHPLAFAIQKNAGAAIRVAARQCAVTKYEQVDGQGVRAFVDGVLVELGNEKLAVSKRWTSSDPKLNETAIRWETEIGATVVWVGINGRLGGILKCEDSMRPSAKDAIAKLQKTCEVTILTGDNRGAAEMAAKNVGIDLKNVLASLTPTDKLNRVVEEVEKQEAALKSLRDARSCFGRRMMMSGGRGTIAMVGDGVNDAPALASADVGVAMGVAGTAAAMETAPVALLTNDLSRLADTIYIGRRCVLKIRQNIFFSVTTKLVVLGLTFAGLAGLWQAVVVDVGSALIVIFNGMSILREADEEDKRRNKISHELGIKHALEVEEKLKLAERQAQISNNITSHSHAHSHAGSSIPVTTTITAAGGCCVSGRCSDGSTHFKTVFVLPPKTK